MQLIAKGTFPSPLKSTWCGSPAPRASRAAPLPRLVCAAAVAVSVLRGGPARAEGEGSITLRGAYYKERATRVVQPMLDAELPAGAEGTVDAHLVVDAITSASISAGAADSAFSEKRYEAGVGYRWERGPLVLGGSLRGSTEPDYKSLFATARGERGIAERNAVLGLTLGIGRDAVSNAGAQGPFASPVEGDLTTVLASASASQIWSETLVLALTYDVASLHGYQQNPYRVVTARSGMAAERHPDQRLRHAVAASSRWYWPSTGSTWIAVGRFYVDDWGVMAATPELRWVQDAGDDVDFAARYRLHVQGAADFYEERYDVTAPELEPYLSADEKLSAFVSHTFEAKVGVRGTAFGLTGRSGASRLDLMLQYVAQGNAFGNAVAGQVALTVPLAEDP